MPALFVADFPTSCFILTLAETAPLAGTVKTGVAKYSICFRAKISGSLLSYVPKNLLFFFVQETSQRGPALSGPPSPRKFPYHSMLEVFLKYNFSESSSLLVMVFINM